MESRINSWYQEYLNTPEEDRKYIYLDLSNLWLENLPQLPNEVRNLNISNNMIERIDYLPENLIGLNCFNNDIVYIDYFPDSLKDINVSYNKLTELPELPEDLIDLNCSNNELYTLPNLPTNLETLECENNKLNALPEMNRYLRLLNCNNNFLTRLPKLSPILQKLDCSNNNLTRLPKLPTSLIHLRASGNPLRQLPDLSNNNFVVLELPELIEEIPTDSRNFNDWNSDIERTQTCFDDIAFEDFDVVEFLTQDPQRKNIILSINGVFKCYNRNTLMVFLRRQGEYNNYINVMNYEGVEFYRLYTREWVSREGMELIMNPMYSIYDLNIDNQNPMLINGINEYAYSVAAYTVDAYVQA